MKNLDLETLTRIAEVEFSQIVIDNQFLGEKSRLFISDGSYIDIWLSRVLSDRFGFHWERRFLDGTFYRYDNFPDTIWRNVVTYPRHFHDGTQDLVRAAPFSEDIEEGFRDFMRFVARKLE